MKRTFLTETEARDLMQDELPLHLDVYLRSKDALNKRISFDLSQGITNHCERVKSMDMWHYAMNISSQMFADHADFKPGIYNQVYGLAYHDAMFIRFKKLNDKFQTSNIETLQSAALDNQTTIETFPSKPCILTVGYVSDSTGVGFKSVNLICSKRKQVLWNINLLDLSSGNLEIPFVPVSPDNDPVSPSIEKLLIIKEEKKRKRNK